jgi:hypothetical protein
VPVFPSASRHELWLVLRYYLSIQKGTCAYYRKHLKKYGEGLLDSSVRHIDIIVFSSPSNGQDALDTALSSFLHYVTLTWLFLLLKYESRRPQFPLSLLRHLWLPPLRIGVIGETGDSSSMLNCIICSRMAS